MEPKTATMNKYLETRVLTASPEQLQLMLYDGAIRFCEQARGAIGAKNIEESFRLLSKAEKIVLEMAGALKDDMAPEICGNMRRLYMFCYDRLVEANVRKEVKHLEEALTILRDMRQTWLLVMEKLQREKEGEAVGAAGVEFSG